MLRSFFVTIIAVLLVGLVSPAFAETGISTGSGILPISPSAALTTTPLLLDTVVATDPKSVTLTFNQSVRVDSIRVRIIDQATNESVKISSITGSTLSGGVAVITTAGTLTSGSSYVITITSALSTTDMTIKAGVDSIREFVAPIFPEPVVLNAPPNPTAVIVATGNTVVTPKPVLAGVATGSVIPKDGALPEAGAPTVILILLAGLASF